MARPPAIGYQDVEEAVRILRDKGKPINPYQVRSVLGKGSEAKILYYLKGMGLDVEYQDDDPLTKRMVNLIRPVVVELNEQYEEQIRKEKSELTENLSQEREKSKAYRAQLDEALKKLEDESQRAQTAVTEIDKLRSELDGEKRELENQRQRGANLEEKLETLQKSLNEAKQHQGLLKSEHRDLIKLLKDEHGETLQGYKEALVQSNRTTEQLRNQLENATNSANHLQNELTSLKTEVAEATLQEKMMIDQIAEKNRQIGEMTSKVESLSARVDSLEKEGDASRKTISALQHLDGENAALMSENEVLKKSNERLTTELDLLKSIIDKLYPKRDKQEE